MKNILKTILVFLFVIPSAVNADEAKIDKFINDSAHEIISIVTNTSLTDEKKSKKLGNVINERFDTIWMSKFVLGREYRSLSQIQQSQYLSLYQKYLQNTYFPILMRYNNQDYTITRITKTGKNLYAIDVTIERSASTPKLNLTYTLRDDDSKYVLLDMAVEGVSTVFTQKSEFSSVLQNYGVDGLFKRLKETTKS